MASRYNVNLNRPTATISGTFNLGINQSNTPDKNEMTDKRKILLKNIMKWYWDRGNEQNSISKQDYEFIYSIWNHGLSFYGHNVQERLNRIRETYLNDLKNEEKI